MEVNLERKFHVVLTADFFDAAGQLKYRDIGLDLLKAQPHIKFERFQSHQPRLHRSS